MRWDNLAANTIVTITVNAVATSVIFSKRVSANFTHERELFAGLFDDQGAEILSLKRTGTAARTIEGSPPASSNQIALPFPRALHQQADPTCHTAIRKAAPAIRGA